MTPLSLIEERRAVYAGFNTRELAVDGNGPTIVLVHGFSHSADVWRSVLKLFAEAGQAAVAVDLPGFGIADALPRGDLMPYLEAFLADLIIQHSTSEPVVVVGNSLGGALAVRAARNPDPAVGAVMPIGAAGISYTALVSRGLVPLMVSTRQFSRIPVPSRVHRAVATTALTHLLYGQRSAADPVVLAASVDGIPDVQAASRLLRLGAKFVRELDRTRQHGGISVPMTILHGLRDRIVPVFASSALHQANPGSRLVVLPQAGHCPQLDAPHDVVHHARELAKTSQKNNDREIS